MKALFPAKRKQTKNPCSESLAFRTCDFPRQWEGGGEEVGGGGEGGGGGGGGVRVSGRQLIKASPVFRSTPKNGLSVACVLTLCRISRGSGGEGLEAD